MARLVVAVMACHARQAAAERIADESGAVGITYDDTLNLWGNRRAALRLAFEHARGGSWCLVLQDDLRLAGDFRARAVAALRGRLGLVSLYLGRRPAMVPVWPEALREGAYVPRRGGTFPQWGQALAVRSGDVSSLIGFGDAYRGHDNRYDDTRCILWARRTGQPIAYLAPSLVDHADVPSALLDGQPRGGRRAIWFADDPAPTEPPWAVPAAG